MENLRKNRIDEPVVIPSVDPVVFLDCGAHHDGLGVLNGS
jgi:hypothetical protein